MPRTPSSRFSADRELSEDLPALRDVPDAEVGDSVRGQAPDGPAVERDASGLGPEVAGNRLHERRLPHAVASDHGHDLAPLDREREALEHAAALEVSGRDGLHGQHVPAVLPR